MNKQKEIIELLNKQGLMPLFFDADVWVSLSVMQALYNGGVRLIEYTNRGVEALQNFTAMKKVAIEKYPDLYLGAGTIKDAATAQLFINAGADFLISPALAMDVCEVAKANNILWIPGCMTPTEILQAEKSGIRLVKLFPGNLLGPSFVQGIKELFPTVQFMPTGGVDITSENLQSWFNAGVCAVGMGSKLITKKILENKSYNTITVMVKELLREIERIKMEPLCSSITTVSK